MRIQKKKMGVVEGTSRKIDVSAVVESEWRICTCGCDAKSVLARSAVGV